MRNRSWRRLWLKLWQAFPGEELQLRRPTRCRRPTCKPWLEILEDRLAPASATVQFGLAKESLLETSGTFTIPVTISASSSTATSVPFTLGGTAVSGTDFTGVTTSPVVIPAGKLAVDITGTLLTPNDGLRTLTFTLGAPDNGAALGGTTVNTLTIDEQSVNPTTVAIGNSNDIVVVNGSPVMDFTVTRTGNLTVPLTVGYTTVAGTAQPATDFTPQTGTAVFSPGSATATIGIPITNLSDIGLTFSVQLTGIVNPPVTFTSQPAVATGTKPVFVAVGDLNGDGKPDLVVANSSDNTVSVLLNTTAPGATTASFATQQTFATGVSPRSVALGDLNGDGKLDIIVANASSNTVSVLMNTTAPGATIPSFATQQTFATGTFPATVAVGDVNGDGKPDLIVANEGDGTVSVLLNKTMTGSTTASFATQETFATGSGPFSLALGDVNGDGLPDLIVGNLFAATVSVLVNTTTPGATTASFATQQTFATGNEPESVALADVNGDGKSDLIVANEGDGTVSVLLNTTTPGATTASFATQQTFATGNGPFSVAVGDVNGDGLPDLVTANYSDDTVSVLVNTTTPGASTASFTAQQAFATGNGARFVALGDLNGNGKPDLIVADESDGTVSVLMNTTTVNSGAIVPAFPQTTFPTVTKPVSVALGDVNGDGKPDLIVANYDSDTVSVLLNTTTPGASTPSFATQITFATGTGPESVALGDVNGDGLPDIIVANEGDGTVSVLMNTTTPGASTPAFATQITFATGTGPESVALGDVNGDGLPDIIVANAGTNATPGNTVSVLMNTTTPGATTPAFATQQTFATGTRPDSVALGDVNGDGLPDIIVANAGTSSNPGNTVSVLLNATTPGAATPAFATQITFAVGTGPDSVALGDVNGDGLPDIIVANAGTSSNPGNTVSVLLNTTTPGAATPAFATQQTFLTGNNPASVTLGDVNGDGLPDILVANANDATVSVLLNATTPGATTASFATQQTFATGTAPESVALGDVSGDGKLDIIVANANSNTVSVLLSTNAAILGDTATGTIPQQIAVGPSTTSLETLTVADSNDPSQFPVIAVGAGAGTAYTATLQSLAGGVEAALDLVALGSYFPGAYGINGRWLLSANGNNVTNGGWYFLLPDGSLHAWDGEANSNTDTSNNTLVAMLNPEVYNNPLDLATAATLSTAATEETALGLMFTGSLLNGYYGIDADWVMSGNGNNSGHGGWYFLTPDGQLYQWNGNNSNIATNDAVGGTSVMTFNETYWQDPFQLLGAPGAATAVQQQNLDLMFTGSYDNNSYGIDADWFKSGNGNNSAHGGWYFLIPTGQLYEWTGGTTSVGPNTTLAQALAADGTPVPGANFALPPSSNVPADTISSFWQDPNLLLNPTIPQNPPAGVTASFANTNSNLLLLTDYRTTGMSFAVQVSVTTHTVTTTQEVIVNVTDQAPTLANVPTQTVAHGSTLPVTLSGSDADANETLTYSAQVFADPNSALAVSSGAFAQVQALGLSTFTTFAGYQGLWMQSNNGSNAANGGWYFLLGNGTLHQWDGGTTTATATTSPIVATFSAILYTNIAQLLNPVLASGITVNGQPQSLLSPVYASSTVTFGGFSSAGTLYAVGSVFDGNLKGYTTFQITVT